MNISKLGLLLLLLFSIDTLNAQIILPAKMRTYIESKRATKTIEIESMDTTWFKSDNKWVFDASAKKYYGVRKDGKSYLYLKEKLASGKYVERLIYDTAVYIIASWGVDKLEEWQVSGNFISCSYQFGKDTFYYKANDKMTMLNDSVFEYISYSVWEDISYELNMRYFFDHQNKLKRVVNFQIAGATDTTITITQFTKVKRHSTIDKAIFDKIKAKHDFALKQKKIVRIEPSLLQKFETKDVRYTYENISIRNQSFSLDSIIRYGNITILYKWFEGCVPCAQLRPYIDTLFRTNSAKGLNIIGLNNVNPKSFLDTLNRSYQTYMCTKTLDNKLEIKGSPTLLIFNNQNQLLARLIGYTPVSVEDLKKYIAELLSLKE